MSLSTLGRLALDAANAGAHVARTHGAFEIEQKTSHRDLVTAVDRAAEHAVVDHLRRHRPDDTILGEEFGERPGISNVRWLVDPIDGTANFVRGRADHATAVAAEIDGVPRVGAIVKPATGEWAVTDEHGVTDGSEPVLVAPTAELARSLVTVAVSVQPGRRDVTFRLLADLLPHIQDFRNTGSSSTDLFAVATGRLDAYIGVNTKPWDLAPGWALVAAAGGRCLKLDGERTTYILGAPKVVEDLAALVRFPVA